MNMTARVRGFVSRMKGAVGLGAGVMAKTKILCAFIWFTIRAKLGKRITRPWHFRFHSLNTTFPLYLSDIFELDTAREIFVEAEYATPAENPHTIIDFGSNIGLSAIYFSLRYPSAHVHAFEPDPMAYDILQQNIASFANIQTYPTAVGGLDGEQQFFSSTSNRLSSSLVKRGDDYSRITVEAKSLDSIINELGVEHVDIVKFDIEGAEYDVFKNFKQMQKVSHFVGEVHTDLIPVSNEEFLRLFSDFKTEVRELKKVTRYSMRATRV